jgi:ribosome modulation factor
MSTDPTTTRDYRTAYNEGYAARRHGAKVTDNPYSIEQARVNGWDDGWHTADDDMVNPKGDRT